jgi:hypothetical protein
MDPLLCPHISTFRCGLAMGRLDRESTRLVLPKCGRDIDMPEFPAIRQSGLLRSHPESVAPLFLRCCEVAPPEKFPVHLSREPADCWNGRLIREPYFLSSWIVPTHFLLV